METYGHPIIQLQSPHRQDRTTHERMIDEYIRQKYPKLAVDYDRREGDTKLSAAHEAIVKKMDPIRYALETYDEEEERGVLHNETQNQKMARYRAELKKLEKECVAACDAWLATIPPYDPDNYISSCGCVVIGDERVHWCGDHY